MREQVGVGKRGPGMESPNLSNVIPLCTHLGGKHTLQPHMLINLLGKIHFALGSDYETDLFLLTPIFQPGLL